MTVDHQTRVRFSYIPPNSSRNLELSYASVAQLVERLTEDQERDGSEPSWGTSLGRLQKRTGSCNPSSTVNTGE